MEIDGHKPPDAFTWKMNDTEHMVVCKEEVSPEQERSPSLVKEEPEPPHIKEEEEELLQRPEESDGSMLLAVKREEDDEEDISSHCSAVEIEVELESDTSDNDVTEDSDEWEETSGGDISLSPVASNSPAANSQHPQRDEPSTSLLANMNPAAVVLHKHPLNMVHQALHPPAPLQQCSSDEEENVNHSYTWWEPKDDSGNNSDWSYSRSKSRSKEKKDKQKKSRKLNKDDTSKTKGMRSQTQVISCSECPEAFTSQVLLHEHIKQSHNDLYCQVWRNEPVTAAAFERITNSVTSQKQGDPDEQRSYSHQQFNWTLTQPEELKTHTDSLNHTGKKTHKCEHCDKSFVRAFDLKTHQVVHTGERKFQCKDCDKSFSQSGGLRRHQRVHTGEKPFHCENCDKNFGRLFDLKRHHQLIHTGEKYLHCEHCDKTFNLLSSLTKHLRVHTGEKPYHCRHCDKSFTQSCNLRSHERVHTEGKPIHCKHCDKSFSRSGYLKKHQHVHTGEKHFNSKHCDKSFNQSNDFDIHQCTHTAEKNIM